MRVRVYGFEVGVFSMWCMVLLVVPQCGSYYGSLGGLGVEV